MKDWPSLKSVVKLYITESMSLWHKAACGGQITDCLFLSPPLPLIFGVQELTWRCVCAHWFSCFSWAESQTRMRFSFRPRKERGSCCCRPGWSCWSGGIGVCSWRSTKTCGSRPLRESLWKRSSHRLWCWLRCRDWVSSGPQTHWLGHCRLSSRSCSYCHWKTFGHSGRWGSSDWLRSLLRGGRWRHLNYLKKQQNPC